MPSKPPTSFDDFAAEIAAFDDEGIPAERTNVGPDLVASEEDVAQVVGDLSAGLETLNYYELLALLPDATQDEIRGSFHQQAALLHPDRLYHHPDPALRERAYTIYKRITEAYRVLSDPAVRRQYDDGLRQGQLRYVAADKRQSGGPKAREDALSSPKAKQFFRAAEAARKKGDLKGAKNNLQLALAVESGSELLRAELDEVNKLLKGGQG